MQIKCLQACHINTPVYIDKFRLGMQLQLHNKHVYTDTFDKIIINFMFTSSLV